MGPRRRNREKKDARDIDMQGGQGRMKEVNAEKVNNHCQSFFFFFLQKFLNVIQRDRKKRNQRKSNLLEMDPKMQKIK